LTTAYGPDGELRHKKARQGRNLVLIGYTSDPVATVLPPTRPMANRHRLLGGRRPRLVDRVQVVFVDSSFNGVFRAPGSIFWHQVEAGALLVGCSAFMPGWIERTFAWLSANQIAREYDRFHANAWICLANIKAGAQIQLTQTTVAFAKGPEGKRLFGYMSLTLHFLGTVSKWQSTPVRLWKSRAVHPST
jgi:hypothetical protein